MSSTSASRSLDAYASAALPAAVRGHNFQPQNYGITPTTCFVCQEFLNGFWQQGFQCTNCSINVHEVCRPQTEKQCFVTHRFKETSYFTLPVCAACGQPMLGLWNQGFQCEDCGLDVHAACRTQSSISNCRVNAAAHAAEAHMLERKASQQLKADFAEKKSHFLQQSSSSGGGGGSSHALAHAQAASDLPTDLDGVIREMRRLHEEILSSNKELEVEWENKTKPALKAQRAQLEQSCSLLKQKLKDKQREMKQLSATRDELFRAFLKNFYTKYNAQKVKSIDALVNVYANGTQKESQLLGELLAKYANEPTAVAMIEHERSFGALAQQTHLLPECILECERLRVELSRAKRALNQINMDVFFSPNLPWAVKGGAEGIFAGFTSLWLERVMGTFKLDCSMEDVGNNVFCPRVSVRLCSNETTSTGGGSGGGFVTSGRMENMCLFGSALPISLSIRDADLSVDFDLSMQIQYETEPGEILGSWKVVDDGNGFKLKMYQFHLKTRGALGALGIPDVMLGTLLQTFITVAFKRIVVLLLPPELGMYMNAIHRHRELCKPVPNKRDVWVEHNTASSKERFIKVDFRINVNQIIKLDMIDAPLSPDKFDLPIQRGALDVLQLDKDQMRLFLQTQKELGLTTSNIFPAIAAGSESWFSSSASQDKANRVPMESIEDCVRYLRDFLDPQNLSSGMKASRRAYSCERLTRLWKIALELVCASLGGETAQTDFAALGMNMLKKIVKRRASNAVLASGPVKLFDFDTLKQQITKVAQKEIYIEVDIPVFSIAVALRGFIRVGKDIALRVLRMMGAKKKDVADTSGLTGNNNNNGNNKQQHDTEQIGQGVASAISQDRTVEMKKANLIPDLGKTLPVQIERGSDFLMDQLRILQERYVDNFEARIGLVSREGNFRATAHEVRVCAPVDVGLQIASPILAQILSRTVKSEEQLKEQRQWLWNRAVVAENGEFKVSFRRAATYRKEKAMQGSMVDALRRMGGKAAAIADNKDTGEFSVAASGFFAQFRSEESAESEDVLSVHLRPVQDPDRVEVKALGTRAMRVHANVDLLEGKGQFATLFHYVDDFLESMGPKNSKMMSMARLFPKFVASFAARDSFFIEVEALVGLKGDSTAGDLVVFASNVEDRKIVRLGLTHNLVDVVRDLMDLLEGATNMSASSKSDE